MALRFRDSSFVRDRRIVLPPCHNRDASVTVMWHRPYTYVSGAELSVKVPDGGKLLRRVSIRA